MSNSNGKIRLQMRRPGWRPQRITFVAHWQLHQRLQQRADQEGRSLSNLIGHLLEVATG
jgi:hypothetical protein